MNKQKICFITCVNDEVAYQESLLYINNLIRPNDFDLEFIAVRNASYITKAYNEAMQSSDAKYKVYLHQDMFIINKRFIIDIVELFSKYPQVGLIGMVGTKYIAKNGCLWADPKMMYGKGYDSHTGRMELYVFQETLFEYESVQTVDGCIMITQYDIPWREDLFTGWHFYDLSQSFEFLRKGYEVASPKQIESWIIHDCNIINVNNGWEKYRQIFLNEYKKEII